MSAAATLGAGSSTAGVDSGVGEGGPVESSLFLCMAGNSGLAGKIGLAIYSVRKHTSHVIHK